MMLSSLLKGAVPEMLSSPLKGVVPEMLSFPLKGAVPEMFSSHPVLPLPNHTGPHVIIILYLPSRCIIAPCLTDLQCLLTALGKHPTLLRKILEYHCSGTFSKFTCPPTMCTLLWPPCPILSPELTQSKFHQLRQSFPQFCSECVLHSCFWSLVNIIR